MRQFALGAALGVALAFFTGPALVVLAVAWALFDRKRFLAVTDQLSDDLTRGIRAVMNYEPAAPDD